MESEEESQRISRSYSDPVFIFAVALLLDIISLIVCCILEIILVCFDISSLEVSFLLPVLVLHGCSVGIHYIYYSYGRLGYGVFCCIFDVFTVFISALFLQIIVQDQEDVANFINPVIRVLPIVASVIFVHVILLPTTVFLMFRNEFADGPGVIQCVTALKALMSTSSGDDKEEKPSSRKQAGIDSPPRYATPQKPPSKAVYPESKSPFSPEEYPEEKNPFSEFCTMHAAPVVSYADHASFSSSLQTIISAASSVEVARAMSTPLCLKKNVESPSIIVETEKSTVQMTSSGRHNLDTFEKFTSIGGGDACSPPISEFDDDAEYYVDVPDLHLAVNMSVPCLEDLPGQSRSTIQHSINNRDEIDFAAPPSKPPMRYYDDLFNLQTARQPSTILHEMGSYIIEKSPLPVPEYCERADMFDILPNSRF